MMRKLIKMVMLAGVVTCSCTQPRGYVINGKVEGGDSTLYLTAVGETGKIDTLQYTRPKAGVFRFEGKLDRLRIFFLTMAGGKGRIPLFMQDTVFTVYIRKNNLGDVRNYTVKGGLLQNRKNKLDQEEIRIYRDRDTVLARFYAAEKNHDIWEKMHQMAGLQVMDEMYDKVENE